MYSGLHEKKIFFLIGNFFILLKSDFITILSTYLYFVYKISLKTLTKSQESRKMFEFGMTGYTRPPGLRFNNTVIPSYNTII